MSVAASVPWTTTQGRELLAAHDVYLDRADFLARLQPPANTAVAERLGLAGKPLVSTGQQLYVDYGRSVLRKFSALEELERDGVAGFFLWLDTDRLGADALATGFAWPVFGSKGRITIAPPGSRNTETRFVPTDVAVLTSAMDRLVSYLRNAGDQVEGAAGRYRALRALFTRDPPATLGELHLNVSRFLVEQVLGFWPAAVPCSDMLQRRELHEPVDQLLSQLDAAHAVVRRELERLAGCGIDCGLTPPREGELPLFASLPGTRRRQRLFLRKDKGDATVTSEDGALSIPCPDGRVTLSLVESVCPWSPDVFLPVFVHAYVSGFVLGRSSVRYWLPMRAVLKDIYGVDPVPVWAPLDEDGAAESEPDSLLYRYFRGETPGSPVNGTGPRASSPSP